MCNISTVLVISDDQGGLLSDARAVAQNFVTYYRSVYDPRAGTNSDQIIELTEIFRLQAVSDEARAILDKVITEDELLSALAEIQTGKVPGPNGFPSEFFKAFMPQLKKHLLEVILFDAGDIGDTLEKDCGFS
ncbi:hypothetical protein NDU88_004074 [Pleurodeles waltl]|uniref:Uncharacterized protein n=1 Tax=Pleurodeles waltl TaxID=8319 RepID=A0AAV7WVG5_PLEWA|nr:hypothetical protein NDU88_004074 [Pleurodeles waltl]